ncbi:MULTISPECIES: hypothetical protein [unclassified Porphyromonas]|uniref:hypothetical protein n=1 Tax=unclassified Porphyromonas TaxID=2645799 RepID=UPI00052D2CDA|nr:MULTISPECIES: hypothetical protein [unclassified Porphyromonas]KGN81878.1 hypothetical protein HQ41_09540 [Porphyromonas sp. COT-290 OH860]
MKETIHGLLIALVVVSITIASVIYFIKLLIFIIKLIYRKTKIYLIKREEERKKRKLEPKPIHFTLHITINQVDKGGKNIRAR